MIYFIRSIANSKQFNLFSSSRSINQAIIITTTKITIIIVITIVINIITIITIIINNVITTNIIIVIITIIITFEIINSMVTGTFKNKLFIITIIIRFCKVFDLLTRFGHARNQEIDMLTLLFIILFLLGFYLLNFTIINQEKSKNFFIFQENYFFLWAKERYLFLFFFFLPKTTQH